VIKRVLQSILVVLAVLLIPLACKQRNEAATTTDETQTISPAAARPGQTGTAEMTQTVELQDGRSEAEGGVLSDSRVAGTVTGTDTTSTAGTTTTGTTGGGGSVTATTTTRTP
jgi:hypothetical protein